jgi:hypothetical protein
MNSSTLLFLFMLISCQLFSQTWTPKAPTPFSARSEMVSFVLNDVAYAGLGDTATNAYSTAFYHYDADADTWVSIAPFPGPARERAVAFAVNGKGYVGLGDDLSTPGGFFKDFYSYDPLTDAWSKIADFGGSGRSDAIAFGIGTTGYVGFGYDTTGTSRKDFWKYNTGANSWQLITSNSSINERWGAATFVFNGKGYVVAGVKGSNYFLSDIQEFNPANNSWTEKVFASSELQFIRARAFLVHNKAYICYGNQDYVASYNLSNNQINNLDDVIMAGESRVSPLAFSVNGKGYFGTGYGLVFGGGGNSGLRNDLWEFSPSVSTSDYLIPETAFSIFPTVGSGHFTVNFNGEPTLKYQLEIITVQGLSIRQVEAVGKTELNLEDIPTGTYYVVFRENGKILTQKIVIARTGH